LVTWVFDEIGCPGAILDDFCIRNLSGNTVGWVFGLSVFSLKGEHIGWYEEGVFFDIENNVLGFIPGSPGLTLDAPGLAPEPALPVLSKRPCVPGLRGRAARPARKGWSTFCLATYLSFGGVPTARSGFIARPISAGPGASHELVL
jgi:hypothetical protein